MPRFSYVSRDSKGKQVTAVTEAESRPTLLSHLRGQGLTVVQLKEVSEDTTAGPLRKRIQAGRISRASIRTADLAVFWREFAAMIAAGLPIVDTLNGILEELEHVRLHRVLTDVVSHMWEGFNLSQSLARHPQVFSPMVVSLIGSAEESGNLSKVTDQLATYLEKRDRILRKVQAALAYPLFVFGFFCLVVVAATFWIIPQFRDIYEGLGVRLPWLTQRVFDSNIFILSHLPVIVGITAAALLAFVLWVRSPKGRTAIDRISIRLPVFGEILRLAGLARFCRTLGILLEGGIPISRALEMAEQTTGNQVLAAAVARSREEIVKGGKIAASFKKQKVFPAMMVRMIAAGEETGSLTKLLDSVSDYYESRVDAALSTLNALIEPVMIIIIGIFVGVFVLAMYLPVFNLASSMRGGR